MNTPANIIIVDWSALGTPNTGTLLAPAFYDLAVNNVPIVGRTVAEFLVFLMEQKALRSPKDIHLVGHSLGAHVSGMAGTYFQNLTGQLVARISGLDPAGKFNEYQASRFLMLEDLHSSSSFLCLFIQDQSLI